MKNEFKTYIVTDGERTRHTTDKDVADAWVNIAREWYGRESTIAETTAIVTRPSETFTVWQVIDDDGEVLDTTMSDVGADAFADGWARIGVSRPNVVRREAVLL